MNDKQQWETPTAFDLVSLSKTCDLGDAAATFLKRLFGPDYSRTHWNWEYWQSPEPSLVLVASRDNHLLGHYGYMGMPMQQGDTSLRGGKSEGSLVNPARIARLPRDANRDVFLSLVQTALRIAADSGVGVIFGITAPRTVAAHTKGGYRAVDLELVRAICLVRAQHIPVKREMMRRALKLAAPVCNVLPSLWLRWRSKRHPCCRPIKPDDGDRLETFCRDLGRTLPGIFTVRRTWPYLKWRYFDNPNRNFEVVGFFDESDRLRGMVALNAMEKGGWKVGEIVDVAALDDKAISALFRHALSWMSSQGVDMIQTWTVKKAPAYRRLNKCLLRNGFWLTRKYRERFIVFSAIGDEAYHPDRWYVTPAFGRI